jgi:tetratricopeptide (TPR) repeat protein
MECAELLFETGHEEAAIALLGEVAADDPTPASRMTLAALLADEHPQQAIAELEQAWDQARRLHSPHLRALCCGNLSVLYQRLGNTPLAARYRQYALAAQMESATDDPEAALSVEALIDLAAVWISTADVVWADCLLSSASAGRPNIRQQAQIASHRGVMAARAGRMDEAIVHWAGAQRQFRAVGMSTGRAHTLLNLGHLLQHQQRPEMARRAFLIARDLFLEQRLIRDAEAADRFARESAACARLRATDPDAN